MQLLQKYADETGHLSPPHRFVPWVVVNNQPLQEVVLSKFFSIPHLFLSLIDLWLFLMQDYKNFATYVCKAFKGSGAPQACKSLVHKKIN